LISEAPARATLVVFHSAVLPYLTRRERDVLRETARARASVWIANEGVELQAESSSYAPLPAPHTGDFLLSLNERPVAWTDPHGTRIRWLAAAPEGRVATQLV
jgi:Uncharacterized protein conserved in bacteria (DUF2332)